VIEARSFGARYAARASWAVRGVDLRIEEGERVLLVGRSGGGKSTLLLGIAGLLDRGIPSEREGALTVGGREADGTGVGVLFQDPESQLVMARSGDDVAFGLEEHCVPTAEIWPRVHEALAAVGFPYPSDHPTSALSGGEKQRLALAGVLALRPRVLLLDEPTASLDPEGARDLRTVLGRLDRRTTLILVDHHLGPAAALVDRIVAIDGERGVVVDGPVATVLRDRRAELEALGAWLPDAAPVTPFADPDHVGHAVVTAEGIGFRYPLAARDALAGAAVTLTEREVLAITGPNGSGKSTLLLILGGLLQPQRGSVRADRIDPRHPEPWRWPATALARRFGSVFQDPDHQFLTTSVRDELRLGPRLQGHRDTRRADELLERLGLGALAAANPFTLSGGEKRRLSVGTALATEPTALFLDEPTYGQDRHTFAGLMDLLRGARASGAAICAATHEPALLEAIGGNAVALGLPA
jgi:energy-coupling factor transporter ATP-binding protein EcfA2